MAERDPKNTPMKPRDSLPGTGTPDMDGGDDTPTARVTLTGASGTPLHRLHLWQFQAVRDALVVAAVIGIFWLGYGLRAVTIPLLVALLLAYLFEPLIDYLIKSPKWRMSRLHAVVFLLFTVIGGLAIVLALVIPLAVGQTARLVSNFNDGTMRVQVLRLHARLPEAFQEETESFLHIFPRGRESDREELLEPVVEEDESTEEGPEKTGDVEGDTASEAGEGVAPVDNGADDAGENAADATLDKEPTPVLDEARGRAMIAEELAAARDAPPPVESPDLLTIGRRGLETVLDVLAAVAGVGLLLFLIPFYFFFFAMSYPKVVRFFRQLIPEKNKPRALELIAKMDRVVSAFVRGRFVIAALMGLLLAAGWVLCGVPYAILLGLVAGAFSLVPYLVGVTLPLAVLVLLVEQLGLPPSQRDIWLGWFGVFLWPTVVWMVVQFLETYVLTPKIAGKAAGLDPVTVVVAVLAGGSLLGVYGMLLAIPLAACLKILITDVLAPRVDQWLKGERPDPLPIERGD